MESLGLDWKILVAQVVNFGILLFVLKKVLYKPLIKSIDARNKKISDAVINSQKIEDRLKKIEAKEVDILDKARIKAKEQRDEMVSLANSEKEKIIEDAKLSAQKEIEKGLESLKSAEKEAIDKLSDKYMDEVVNTLYKKFAADTKKKGYPLLKSLTKNG